MPTHSVTITDDAQAVLEEDGLDAGAILQEEATAQTEARVKSRLNKAFSRLSVADMKTALTAVGANPLA